MSIEIKNVTYTYMPKTPFERTALKGVDLVIEEGSFTAIAGHTGSGKSTLVQHLNGLLEPTSGQVLVDGVDLNGKGSKSEKLAARDARRKVGMVFCGYCLCSKESWPWGGGRGGAGKGGHVPGGAWL